MKRDSIYTIAILCLAFGIVLGFGYFVGVHNDQLIARQMNEACLGDLSACEAALVVEQDQRLTCDALLTKRANQLTWCIDALLDVP